MPLTLIGNGQSRTRHLPAAATQQVKAYRENRKAVRSGIRYGPCPQCVYGFSQRTDAFHSTARAESKPGHYHALSHAEACSARPRLTKASCTATQQHPAAVLQHRTRYPPARTACPLVHYRRLPTFVPLAAPCRRALAAAASATHLSHRHTKP